GKVMLNSEILKTSGMPVKFGDTIATGPDSLCDIIILGKNILRIGSNSKLIYRVSSYENTLQLDSGWMSGVTKKIFTPEGKYLIKTPTVTASIRGTSYCIKIENPESTYF